ncbi:hypothetical protein Dimus_031863, partial [Dionaea muscipula]
VGGGRRPWRPTRLSTRLSSIVLGADYSILPKEADAVFLPTRLAQCVVAPSLGTLNYCDQTLPSSFSFLLPSLHLSLPSLTIDDRSPQKPPLRNHRRRCMKICGDRCQLLEEVRAVVFRRFAVVEIETSKEIDDH